MSDEDWVELAHDQAQVLIGRRTTEQEDGSGQLGTKPCKDEET